jgi:hypothetical protein
VTALGIILLKKAYPDFAAYLDDPSVTPVLVDWLTQAAPVIAGTIAAYFTRNAKT